jgi:UDP-glucose 4-epimerase
MPYIAQVAIGRRESVNVFGEDYDTHDGTGVRDYIHVTDLAIGHLKALNILDKPHCTAINLGTGKGYSVLDVINAFSKASGKNINYTKGPRRAGDIASCYAEPTKAKELLDWEAKFDLDKMCEDMWRFQQQNPKGYNR